MRRRRWIGSGGRSRTNNLTIASGNSLSTSDGQSLTINGNSISNSGTFTLNSAGTSTQLLLAGSSVTLSGGGTLVLSDSLGNSISGAVTGTESLTNQETIQGSGYLGYNPTIGSGYMTLINQGTINAVSTHGNALQIVPGSGGVTNTGTMEAVPAAPCSSTAISRTRAAPSRRRAEGRSALSAESSATAAAPLWPRPVRPFN